MKRVETWLNEDEYARFQKKCKAKGLTEYAFAKEAILKEVNGHA